MDEIDIWRVAALLIKTHEGHYASAAFAAGHRAKELREEGAHTGADVWEKIEAKVKELEGVGYGCMKKDARSLRRTDAISGFVTNIRAFHPYTAHTQAVQDSGMPDTATKLYRVYFDEHSRTELIVHAASADEAKARCDKRFRECGPRLPDEFKVRTAATEWKTEELD